MKATAKNDFAKCISRGKTYEIVKTVHDLVTIIDNDGHEIQLSIELFDVESVVFEYTKQDLIDAFRDGFYIDLPFCEPESWFNEKYGK